MPDLLSHALFAYAAFSLISVRWTVGRHGVTAGMLGAILPDAGKFGLFVDDDVVEALLGSQVDFLGWHTAAGVMLSLAIIALLVDREHRRTTATFVTLGVGSHIWLDLLLRTASGLTPYALFWPFTAYRPPTAGLYLSGDVQVLGLALVTAVSGWAVARTDPLKNN